MFEHLFPILPLTYDIAPKKNETMSNHTRITRTVAQSLRGRETRGGEARGALGAYHPHPLYTSATHGYPIIAVLPPPCICKIRVVLYYLFYAAATTAR